VAGLLANSRLHYTSTGTIPAKVFRSDIDFLPRLQMKIDEWMRQRRLHRLLIMVPFWTVAYFIGTLICHWVFGWETRWQQVIFWGLFMGVGYTLWPPGRVSTKNLANR
jgi:hypothetical protein